jgi:hypothetical protein
MKTRYWIALSSVVVLIGLSAVCWRFASREMARPSGLRKTAPLTLQSPQRSAPSLTRSPTKTELPLPQTATTAPAALSTFFLAFVRYADDHSGSLPESLEQLQAQHFEAGIPVIVDPASGEAIEVEYIAGRQSTDPPESVLLATGPLPSGQRAVCLLNGSLKSLSEAEYQEAVRDTPLAPDSSH